MNSLQQTADLLRVTQTTIKRWIAAGKLDAGKDNGITVLPHSEKNNAFIVEKLRQRSDRPIPAWVPSEIKGYDKWHQCFDELVWLIKVCYSHKDDLKRRRFRLDQLLFNYLSTSGVKLQKVKAVFATNESPKQSRITDDVKRGWYNELAYATPMKPSTLGLSFSDIELNKSVSTARFAFPSWRIVAAYYSVYFYLRAVTLQKQSSFRLEQHGATLACFKSSVLSPLQQAIWKFPLDIAYCPGKRLRRKELLIGRLRYSGAGYARHPRSPNRTPMQVFDNIYATFRKRSQGGKNATMYTLFDYFHDFRVWANYLDIDNLLSLRGSGYRAILDQNLAVLLFFIGSISEVCFIALFGERRYLQQLQNLYTLLAMSNSELEAEFIHTPVFQRLQVYNQLGLVKGTITLQQREDINLVRVQ
jgi:hypothetical protein